MSDYQLAQARAKAAELRDINAEVADLTERLTTLNKRAWAISHDELPQLLADLGLRSLELEAAGNMPAFELKLKPYYSASIAAKWEDERRSAAFAYLESEGAADLIKTEITIALPREKRAEAKELVASLAAYGPQVKENVHSSTLTAWVREQSEAGNVVDLDAIGAKVGMVVEPKKSRSNKQRTTI